MPPSQEYRDYLRYGVRVLRGPDHQAAFMGERISDMKLADLEAAHELVMRTKTWWRPANYRPRPY